jgi:hypothetical protein
LINKYFFVQESTSESNIILQLFNTLDSLKKGSDVSHDSDLFLRRLQAILFASPSVVPPTDSEEKPGKGKFPYLPNYPMASKIRGMKSISDMDKDELRKVQTQSFHTLERCCNVLEQIEKSPIEHYYNEQLLMLLAMKQRANIFKSFDICHDGSCLPFSPKELQFPFSKTLTSYLNSSSTVKSIQNLNSSWQLKGIYSTSTNASSPQNLKNFYFHKEKNIYQLGEPFDLICKKNMSGLKQEKWSDYQVYTNVSQKSMESDGIEFYSDQYQGYLFYCPKRKLFSSNGIFDSSVTDHKKRSLLLEKFLSEEQKVRISSKKKTVQNDFKESNTFTNFWANKQFKDAFAFRSGDILEDELLVMMAEERDGEGEHPLSPTKKKKKFLGGMLRSPNSKKNRTAGLSSGEMDNQLLKDQLLQCFRQGFLVSNNNGNKDSIKKSDDQMVVKGSRYNKIVLDQQVQHHQVNNSQKTSS